jgi:hypothetical protein
MMKIYELRKYVYQATETKNTKDLKKKHSDLVKGKDLRNKSSWLSIYNSLKVLEDFRKEQASKDLEKKYGYKNIDKNCSVADLIHNIEATNRFREDFEEELNSLEKKYTK